MITYLKGDATEPVGDGPKYLAHICNDIGGWGSGFVNALSARWPEPEQVYRDWHRMHVRGWHRAHFELGYVRLARVAPDLVVCNMIAQRGTGKDPDGGPCIRYGALQRCLEHLAECAASDGSSVHMPRIGAGLAGGDWETIEKIIVEELCMRQVPVTVYDLE